MNFKKFKENNLTKKEILICVYVFYELNNNAKIKDIMFGLEYSKDEILSCISSLNEKGFIEYISFGDNLIEEIAFKII